MINPVGIFGPVLGADVGSSVQIVARMLSGKVPAAPNVRFGVVDVRDVADLHLLAMVDPKANGERFIAVAGEPMSMLDVARVLRTRLGAAGAAAPKRSLPDFTVRLMSVISPGMRSLAPQLGVVRSASNAKAKERLGWTPRPNDEVIAAHRVGDRVDDGPDQLGRNVRITIVSRVSDSSSHRLFSRDRARVRDATARPSFERATATPHLPKRQGPSDRHLCAQAKCAMRRRRTNRRRLNHARRLSYVALVDQKTVATTFLHGI